MSEVFLNWTPSSNYTAQGYVVSSSTAINGVYTPIASWNANTSPQYIDTTAANGTTHYYKVAAINQSGVGAYSAPASATPEAAGSLPADWTDVDIGAAGLAGGGMWSGVSSNTFIIRGSGSGIGAMADSFNFACKNVTGNFTITGRLAKVRWVGSGKVGLMVRESLDPTAKAVVVALGGIGKRECTFGARSSKGGFMRWERGNDYTWLPVWFKLQRTGNTFTAYQSLDGRNWFGIGSSTVTMPDTCRAGIAVGSGNREAVSRTVFDNVMTCAITAADINESNAHSH